MRRLLANVVLLAYCFATFHLQAGGSGFNTLVVINQSSSNSCELGNYFCERRQVPPENVLYIHWTGGNISWSTNDFQTVLVNPLLAALSARQLTNQIDYVALSMDIPFQTTNSTAINSTTAALFYGWKDGVGTENSYANSEAVFRQCPPNVAPGYSFLTTMITSDSLANAKRLVDRGVASDGTFPHQPVVLAKSSDLQRNVRYHAFDNARFNALLHGNCLVVRTNSDFPASQTNLFGYETGLSNFSVSPETFVPGAIADNFTSFGGIIFGPNGQTSLLAFINAGASGSYGTVTEPTSSAQKFPDPQVYFYQSRGFNLAESYYQNIGVPYQGLIVAEPLSAPFQQPGSGAWIGISSNTVLSGTTRLSLQFAAADWKHPLRQVDLFVDGKFFQTLTNIAPAAGNVLSLNLPGAPLTYIVPSNATLFSITTNLTALINDPAVTNLTAVTAAVHGDRIELKSLSNRRVTPPTGLRLAANASNPGNINSSAVPSFISSAAGSTDVLTTFFYASRNSFMNSPAFAFRTCNVNGTAQIGSWARIAITKIGGAQVALAVTNQSPATAARDMAAQMVTLINSSPDLQGPNGIYAEMVVQGFFTVRARTASMAAAAAQICLTASSNLTASPATTTDLTENLSDLQPRNHLYVTVGATNLAFSFPLVTTVLADGFHELTAIAYEGSHVRTQSRVTLPVRIQNSPLNASLNLLDLPASAPVQGTYHIEVIANTTASTITLFSTGGTVASVNNQATATFVMNGSSLGVGLHPFYAVVTTSSGAKYQTEMQRVRLTN